MSEDTQSTEVVDWEEEMARQAKAVAAIERPRVSMLGTRAGILTYQKTPIPGNKMNCIVVSAIHERNYFKDKFDSENIRPPDCYAFSVDGADMKPEESIEKPIHEDCPNCPYNEWKSDKNSPSGRGKLCKEIRKLALVAYNSAGDYTSAELAILRVPITSVPNWGMHVNRTTSNVNRPYYAVVTEISAAPHIKNQFEIRFTFVEKLEMNQFQPIMKLRELAERILMTPYDAGGAYDPAAAPKDSAKF